MARTAEVVFLGDASSVERAASLAAKATAEAAEKVDAAGQKAAAAQEAAAARIARAQEKAVASAKKANAEFAKWGTVAAAGVIAGSVDMAIHVESAATAIAKASGSTVASGERIESAFRKIPGTVEYSGAKIGEAFASVAGELRTVEGHALNASQAMKVMNAALDLTDATGEDLKQTTESLGKVMLTYGLHAGEAAKASDVLFNASKQTGTTITEVTQVIDRMHGRLGVLAPSLGETAGLMEELAKHGISGRQTLSTLNGVFSTLEGSSKQTKAAIKELGLEVFDSSGHFVGLQKVIAQLQPTLAKYNQQTQLEYTRALFGAGANRQLLSVIQQGPKAYESATTAVQKHGAATKAAEEEHKTLEGKLKATKAEVENLTATLGEKFIPIVQKVVEALDNSIKWLDKHKEAAKALAIVITTVLGGAMVDFAVTKAIKFQNSLKSMADGLKWLAARFGLVPTAAEIASAKTIAAQTATTSFIVSSDGEIVAANAAAGKSFTAMLGPLGIAAAAVLAFNEALPSGSKIENLLGGNQPGEAGREGQVWAKQHGTIAGKVAAGKQSDTAGGIMAFFMSKGLTAAQAAGIVGNIQQESSLNPSAPGGGLFQDEGSRAASGKGTAKQQIEAAWKELAGEYSSVLAELRKAKTPEDAARIFSGSAASGKGFERPGTPDIANRERYAREAFTAHPQRHSKAEEAHTKAMEKHAKALEGHGKLPTIEELTAKQKKAPDLTAQIDKWAEEHVGKFAESTGKNTGPELDALQKEFHTRAAAWCAEFATTAAMMGGANKAVRTASVATIREWAEAGTHGYQKGVSKTPHVGDMMMFGNDHVGFVQSVHGDKVTTIEGNTSGGKVEVIHRKASEGTFATPIYRSGGAGSVIREGEAGKITKRIEEAIARSEKLVLTAAEHASLHGHVAAAGNARATFTSYAEANTSVGAFLQARQAKWALEKPDLTTAQGQGTAKARDEQAVLTAQTEKKYYEREVKALQKEASEWGKIRDSYRKFARHAKGPGAKKEALKKAAEFEAKVRGAEKEAKELGGNITSTELTIQEAEGQLNVALPEEIAQAAETAAAKVAEGQSDDLSAYSGANSKVDAELRAGLITEDQAKAAKIANAQKALAGGYGALSEEGILQVKGDLKEFAEAVTQATNALEAHTKALEESAKVLREFNQESTGLAQVESGVLAKGLADLVSGQIGGRPQVRGAGRGAPSGSAARY